LPVTRELAALFGLLASGLILCHPNNEQRTKMYLGRENDISKLNKLIPLTIVFTAMFAIWNSFPDSKKERIIDYVYIGIKNLLLDNKALSIRDSKEIDIVYIVDVTGSMGYAISQLDNLWDNLLLNLKIDGLNPNFGVIIFSDDPSKPEKLISLESSEGNYLELVAEVAGAGKYNGDFEEKAIDGIEFSILNVDWRKNSNRMILLITDSSSKANSNGLSNEEIIDGLARNNIFFSSIMLNPKYKDNHPYKDFCDGINTSMSGMCEVHSGGNFEYLLKKVVNSFGENILDNL